MTSRLVATRLTRSADGRAIGVKKIYTGAPRVGATKPNFAVPSGLDSSSAAPATLNAANALMNAYASGVPSEHAYSAVAAAFQSAWNADPAVVAAGASATLDVDGGYGPNTHDAVAAINGGSAPDVNTAPAPPGSTPASTTVVPGSSSSSSQASIMAGMPTWGLWLVGLAAVGGAYLVGKSAIEKHGGKVMGHARTTHRQLRHHARRLARSHRR